MKSTKILGQPLWISCALCALVLASSAVCASRTSLRSFRCSFASTALDGDLVKFDGTSRGVSDRFNWGNQLSQYWQARGLAALAGVPFESRNNFPNLESGSLLSLLPSHVVAAQNFKNEKRLREVCTEARGDPGDTHCATYPHMCHGAWSDIRPLIQHDTSMALQEFSTSRKVPLPRFGPNEVLIHLRLSAYSAQIQWPGRSSFIAKGVLPSGTTRVRILHQAYLPEHFNASWTKNSAVYGNIHDELRKPQVVAGFDALIHFYKSLLKDECGDKCEVTTETGSQVEDFMKIATAPTVFCMGSTFCLWAGLGNSVGDVHFPAGTQSVPWADGGAADLGPRWHWRKEPRLSSAHIRDFAAMSPEQVETWIRKH